MKAIGAWQGGFQTVLADGSAHAVTVDLPRDEGGGDTGTSALELCVLSLAGCITTIFALVAKKRRLKFADMRVDLDAARPEGSPTIASVDGVLRIATAAPRAEVETVLDITMRTCPVGVLFERAQIPVHVHLDVVATEPPEQAPRGSSTAPPGV
ncbi:MAG TPA: OsmC family protein [Thermoplasmata archaeon]|nr:OsmC family protein [Thermoplasmata archaeon]